MKSLTLHNIEDGVYQQLQMRARADDSSLNKIAKIAMKEGLGIIPSKKKRDLSWMVNYWTKEEADRFDKIIEEEFERIDEEDWK